MSHFLFALVTAPGVILHELGHFIFCFLSGVKVFRVKFFSFKKHAGFVEHAEPKNFIQSLLISFGPLTVNSLVSLILFSQITPPYFSGLRAFEIWLGIASALHAFPSGGDAKTLTVLSTKQLLKNPLAVLGYPFVLIIYVLNFLKRFHLHFIYVAILFWLGSSYLK